MTAITTGLSALLYMCASGRIDKSNAIHYLIYDNTYDKSRYSSTPPRERDFATDIANSLGYDIRFHGPYSWWCPPPYERNASTKITFSDPDVKVDNLNHVSANALLFLKNVLAGTHVEIYPEGASCFSGYRSLGAMPNTWVKQFRPRIASVKRRLTTQTFVSKKNWLLPDRFGKVRSATRGTFGVDVFDESNLYDGYRKSALFFINKHEELDFSKYTNGIVFHPMLESLSEPNYESWFNGLAEKIGDSALFVKAKPRMREIRFPRAVKKYDFLSVPSDFNALPAELILEQFTNRKYFGYYSSILLGFDVNVMDLIPPPDPCLVSLYDETYAGLKAVLNL
jgi:hypothetical protein